MRIAMLRLWRKSSPQRPRARARQGHVRTDWFADPSAGGFYQALADGV